MTSKEEKNKAIKHDPVKIALRIDEELWRVDEHTREQVLDWLWFTYIGRYFDWWQVRLRRKPRSETKCANETGA